MADRQVAEAAAAAFYATKFGQMSSGFWVTVDFGFTCSATGRQVVRWQHPQK